jgi:hypothetical protein
MYIKKLTLNVFWSNGRNFFLNTNKGLEIRGSIGGLENLRALLLHAKGELPPSPRLRRTSRRAEGESWQILSGTKVNLPFLEVDLENGDAEVGAGLVDFSGAATSKGSLGSIEGEEVVLNR